MPAPRVLIALLVLAFVPPFVAQASGSVVGSFTMFNRIERYHLELWLETPEGARQVRLRTLAPHLSRDAARILLPAEGFAVGADQVDLVADGLTDLARLVCSLHPEARAASVRMVRDPFDASRASETRAQLACEQKK